MVIDQTQVDLFLASLMGGVVGGALLMTTMYYHMKAIYLRYREAKDAIMDVMALRKAQADIEKLQMGLKAVCKELYEQHECETK